MAKFRFHIDETLPRIRGICRYVPQDLGFAFEPDPYRAVLARRDHGEISSLMIRSLELRVTTKPKTLLYAEGYHTYHTWIEASLPEIMPLLGGVRFEATTRLDAGMGVTFHDAADWPTTWDPQSGWVCIGQDDPEPGTAYVEFATNTVAAVWESELVALWLRPAGLENMSNLIERAQAPRTRRGWWRTWQERRRQRQPSGG